MKINAETYQILPQNKIVEGVYSTNIEGMFYVEHKTFPDQRGFFSEILKTPEIEEVIGQPFQIKQVNHARSLDKVVRGIHCEGWNKFITITDGICFSAIVDVRPNSTTFGEKEYFLLGQGDEALDGSVYIPAGCGNSMCVIEGPVDYLYFVDRLYQDRDKAGDLALSLFDEDIAIQWPLNREDMILSERDINAITLREKYPEKFK